MTTIDESLYSRQLYALGHETMNKLSNSSVLVYGLSGLGVEISKNLILTGFKEVGLYDPKNINLDDLSVNYYVEESDIGKSRLDVTLPKLAELNSYVNVTRVTNPLESIQNYNVVVCCLEHTYYETLLEISKLCRENNIKFIATTTMGLFGQVFCDFGSKFYVTDVDGEHPASSLIESITKNVFTTTKLHNLATDDKIKLINIPNYDDIYTVRCIDKYNFSIENVNIEKYTGNGEFIQLKQAGEFDHLSFEESFNNPSFVITDYADFDKPNKFHKLYQTYLKHIDSEHTVPSSNIFDSLDIDKNLVKMFIHNLKGSVCPMNSVIGGIVAQEVVKAVSHKYVPISQWLYLDSFKSLPNNYEDIETTESRYFSQTKIFGNEFQEKLKKQKYFIVGSGAIGCELLKNFAMMGLGNIIITDPDTIEKSNLNRQFLFRQKDIGHHKSITAATAVKKMNPDINIEPHINFVNPSTELVYNSHFYRDLSGIANALDNVEARKYMDNQAIIYKKPLLESGTLSTKCNVQVILPYLTETYGAANDPHDESIPVCTVKSFPNAIEHCIQYSRELFEGLFNNDPQILKKYIEDPTFIKKLSSSEGRSYMILTSLKQIIENIPKSYEDCLRFGYTLFYKTYRDQIANLLNQFPPDTLTKDGLLFWAGAKRCPHTIDEVDKNFVITVGNIWANIFNIPIGNSDVLNNFTPPDLVISSEKISVTDEEEKKKQENMECNNFDELIASIPELSKMEIYPQEFEKDNDGNYHIDFITFASNLRARNYSIEEKDRHTIKGIVGKIIPALPTTTSVVAGLVALELYKLVAGHNTVEQYNNAFINLGLSIYAFSEPSKPKGTKYKEHTFNVWSNFILYADEYPTLESIINYFKTINLDISMIAYGESIVYASYLPQDTLDQPIKKVLEELLEEKIPDMINLIVDVDDDNANIPYIRYYF